MRIVMKNLGNRSVAIIFILLLGAWPVGATVSGDMAAGVPLVRVIANGLGAGLTIEAIVNQALDAGAAYCPLLKAALAQRVDMARVFRACIDRCSGDTKLSKEKLRNECDPCNLMSCAVEAGRDMVEVADAMVAAGVNLARVKGCLAGMGYSGGYNPPGPPAVPPGIGPTFPGGGAGGIASPSS